MATGSAGAEVEASESCREEGEREGGEGEEFESLDAHVGVGRHGAGDEAERTVHPVGELPGGRNCGAVGEESVTIGSGKQVAGSSCSDGGAVSASPCDEPDEGATSLAEVSGEARKSGPASGWTWEEKTA